ncbi:MAG: RNase P subunit p30 family protein [Halobacteria archaeon]|nr:RNase P subunit p30 family protein [Halobacteria archaeon]
MFEFVHVAPEAPTTLERMALTADCAGYSSVVVRNHSDSLPDDVSPNVSSDVDVDVYKGVEIRAETPDELHGYLGGYAGDEYDCVCVHGGDEAINRAAVASERVDLLCHPHEGRHRGFNHVLVKQAAENDVALEFSLRNVLRESGGRRVHELRDMKLLLKLVRKYSAPFVVSVDPLSHLEVRGAREVEALCEMIGFEKDEIREGTVETPRGIVEDKEDEVVEVL